MTSDDDFETMLVELAADDDVRKILDDLALSFDEALRSEGIKKSHAANLAGMDPSVLSRLINGRNPNPSLLTVAKVYRALGRRLELGSALVCSIEPTRDNWRRSVDYDAAIDSVEIFSSHQRTVGEREKWHASQLPKNGPKFRYSVSDARTRKELSTHQ